MTTEIEQVTNEALTLPDQARAIQITDKDSYAQAGAVLLAVKQLRKKIKSTFKPMKDAATASHKAILEQERQADAPLVEAEAILTPAMTAYDEKYGAPKTEGLRKPQEIWKYEIISLNLIPDEFWMLDKVKLGEHVRTMKERSNIPGIETYCERGGVRIEKNKQIEF